MTLKELTNDIMDEVTFSGALPFKLPIKEVERIVNNAKRYFYDYWGYATQKQHLILPKEIFYTSQFQKTRGIFLPDCIQYVHECEEIKSSSIFGSIDRDLSDQKFVGSELFLTPFLGEALIYRVAMFSFLDLTKNLSISTIAYDYKHTNHFLQILGRTPKTNVHLFVTKQIEDQYLFTNEIFQRYVRAKSKIRTHEIMSVVGGFQLPGEFKFDYAQIYESALKEMQTIEDSIRDENVPDFIFVENY